MKKHRIVRVVALIVLFGMVSTCFVFADSTATVSYKGFMSDETQQMSIYYDDSYWMDSSTKYNEHLASLSMAMILAGYTPETTNLTNALKSLGCSEIKNKAYKPNTENSVTAVLGRKKLKDGTVLVPVVVYSSSNNNIWIKNVQAGNRGDALGYKFAVAKVYNYVTNYINEQKIKKSKIWIVGHSRYGAIANLTAKKLNKKYGCEKVYAYCFENPMVTVANTKNSKVTNIHNVRDTDSGVTSMFPGYMKFGFYGKWDRTFAVSNGNEEKMREMLALINTNADSYQSPSNFRWIKIMGLDLSRFSGALNSIKNGKGVKLDDFCDKGQILSQKEFWNLLINRLKVMAKSRKAYASTKSEKSIAAAKKFGYGKSDVYTIEKSLQTGIKLVNNMSSAKSEQLKNEIADNLDISLTEILSSPFGILLQDIIVSEEVDAEKFEGDSNADYAKYVKKLWDSTKLQSSKALTKLEKKQMKLILSTMIDPLLKVLEKDFDGNRDEEVLITFIYNFNYIMQAHYPEITMAWLMTEDSNYIGN